MLRLNQHDKRWGDTLIGQSNSKISDNGCLICALCMLWSKFHYKGNYFLRPDECAREWKFTSITGDSSAQYLNWQNTKFDGMEFVWRQYGYSPEQLISDPVTQLTDTQENILKKYMSREDYGVVLQVQTKTGQHWICGISKAILGWACNDPWNGSRLWFAPFPYKRILGYAIMKKT